MDNEQAKLILQAYRPGGEDAEDPFFSEALDRARLDPELAKWFAEQRAFDEAMRKALQTRIPPVGCGIQSCSRKRSPPSRSTRQAVLFGSVRE